MPANPKDAPSLDPRRGHLHDLGALTRIEFSDRKRPMAWPLKRAPRLVYHACASGKGCDADGLLGILHFPRAKKGKPTREYTRTHWGHKGDAGSYAGEMGVPGTGFATNMGTVRAVTYTTEKGGDPEITDYEHEFGDGARGKWTPPILAATPDGLLFFVGGSYRVTSRGIVG